MNHYKHKIGRYWLLADVLNTKPMESPGIDAIPPMLVAPTTLGEIKPDPWLFITLSPFLFRFTIHPNN
jgi:hypothetical protein